MPEIDWSVVAVIAFVILWLAAWGAVILLGACAIAGWIAGWIADRWLR